MVSCNSSPSDQDIIKNLTGYWQIDKVKQEDGQVRKYKFTNTIDYIQVDSTGAGFRLKGQPQMDSSFKTTKKAEYFQLKREDDSLRFYYKTRMDHWTETLLSADKDQFTVKNARGMVYTYRRFESLHKELEAHEHAQKQQ